MNAKQTYLAWVRTAHPKLYYAALQRRFLPQAGLAGLGDDLTSSIDPGLSDVSISAVPIDTDVTSSITTAANNATAVASSDSSTDWFGQMANAISSLGSTIVQTQAQQNLLQINTARARQGLAPLTANGVPVTGSMLSPTSATIQQMEAALSGGGGTWLLLGAAVLIGALLLSSRRKSS